MPSTTYSCLIVDDSEIDRLTALAHARQYPMLEVIGMFESATDALPFLQEHPVEVLLLDVDMPGLNGIELRARLMQIPVCVFITAYPDYAAESFAVDAFDYLVKPIRAERFRHTMDRIGHFFELNRKAQLFDLSLGADTVFIKDGHRQVKLKLHEIVYLEGLKDYTRIVTPTQQYTVLSSIGTLLQNSSFGSFLRIHRSYAVQRHFIDRIEPQQIQVQQFTLPIGRSYRSTLDELIARQQTSRFA
ncbi:MULTISPECIES: LytTR family DNA-binding domain-containing protein [unclassified Spirosoma]|uniref:LytR/AlgR family response regulator transcription factor n=1 Tax=unclassified Spirosoma TaxID=2621999 RepID=UPI00095A36D5|nr:MULTISPECIES: LytTR family DNA-binding domain-containing protein [unclassified Spirosoma]MBN8825195.1 response regulator transcription factor [Spirosoma sp.]OJW77126.1 MAG: DNA-binding response regulator [Spirosoma sp. 48-14]